MVTREQIQQFVDEVDLDSPATEPSKNHAASNGDFHKFDLDDWITRYVPEASAPEPYQGGRRWQLSACVFNPDHVGSAIIGQTPKGAMFYTCLHNSCANRNWRNLRELREPGYRDRKNGANAGQPSDKTAGELSPVVLRELMRNYPELRPPSIDGLLRRGQVGNLVSTSKAYKTFLVLMLAICMAMKKFWLDVFPTAGGRVLIIDLELQQPDLVKRLSEIAKAMHAPPEIFDQIHVLSFRGRAGTIDNIERMLMKMEPRAYDLIVLDPLYKTYPPQFDENSNAQMTALYRRFEQMAEHMDCALMIVHHATKGSQSEKRVVDVGAGAGSQSRSADCHIALREHEVENCVVFDARVRSFKPPEPMVLRFAFPLWQRELGLDPSNLKGGRQRKIDEPEKPTPEPWTPERFAREFLTSEPRDKRTVIARSAGKGVSARMAEGLIGIGLEDGSIHPWTFPKSRKSYLATVPQPITASAGGAK